MGPGPRRYAADDSVRALSAREPEGANPQRAIGRVVGEARNYRRLRRYCAAAMLLKSVTPRSRSIARTS